MKKILKFLPLFLLAVVLGVILALNTGATETAKYKVYLAADTALNVYGDEIDDVRYNMVGGENGYVEVFNEIKTLAADLVANDDGTLVIEGVDTEVWVYVSGEVASKYVNGTNTRIGGSDYFGSAIWIKGSNGKWVTIHVTSADVSDPGTLFGNFSQTGTVWAFNNDLAFENITIKVQTQNTNGGTQWNVGEANRFYIGEGVTPVVIKKDDTVNTSKPALRMGSRDNNNLKEGMTGTVLSGAWGTIDMYGGYRGHVRGDVSFTFGGTASCSTLAGWGSDSVLKYNKSSDKYSLFPNTDGVGGDYLNDLHVNLTCNITGGTISTAYYAGFSDKEAFAPITITGNLTTTVSGSASIKSYYG